MSIIVLFNATFFFCQKFNANLDPT